MITIKNNQRAYKLDIERIRTDVQALLTLLNYADFELGILLTTDTTIQKYNKEYRGKDTPTDILSFPFYPTLQAGKRIKAPDPEEKYLGDLVLSVAYVMRAAEKLNVPFYDHMRRLLVHGICHLLGYDHEIDSDWRRMRAKEGYLLKKLKEINY